MAMDELGFTPVAQSFAASYVNDNEYQVATHTFVAPESHPILPIKELEGDIVPSPLPTMDTPNLKSLSGIIVICIMTAAVLSMFACIGRSDFTFPFLLFAYVVWCWESSWSSSKITHIADKQAGLGQLKAVSEVYEQTAALVSASTRTVRNIQGVTLLLVAITLVDALWIFAAYNAWTCDFEDKPADLINLDTQRPLANNSLYCFNEDTQRSLMITYPMHRLVLWISNINFALKIVIICLSAVWANQQRKAESSPPDLS